MLRKLYLWVLSVTLSVSAAAQVGSGTIKGKLLDQTTGEPVPLANVVAKRNGVVVTGAQTDFDGVYVIKPLEPGRYDVEASFAGFATKRVAGVLVNSDQITYLDIKLSSSVDIKTVEVTGYKVPLIQKDGQSKTTVDREAIQKMPQRDVASIAATVGGVGTAGTGGGISIRGSRPDGGNFIYIDGIKVRGSSNLPKSALQEVTVIPGGLPANYGDVTGGIISITTRGPSAEFNGSVEAVSSGFKTKNGVTGLDNFGYNLLEGYLAGPLWTKTDADGIKKPIIGFSASLNYTGNVDTRPSAIGVNTISPEAREKLLSDLVYTTDGDAVRFSSQDLRRSAFTNRKTNDNVGSQTLSGNFKLDIATTSTINLTFGGSFNYDSRRNYSFANQFMNSENNSLTNSLDWRAFARFTQRFKSNEESASNIKNVFYNVMLDYNKQQAETMNADHKRNFFDYGYVGKFKIYKDTAQYEFVPQGNYLRQNALPGDTLIEFTPGDKNPILARYTSEYFELFNSKEDNYEQINQITKGGLRNGDAPQTVYGLFNAIGAPAGGYGKTNNSQFRITANGSADIGNHAVQAGFEYEQRDDRFFGYNNLVANENGRNTNVWAVGRNLMNSHLKELDYSDSTIHQYDANGNLLPFPIVTFNTLRGPNQSSFDRNLRLRLGLDPNGTDFVNIDELDPSVLSMQDFNSDELINSGNSLVTYFGYDHKGNKLKGRPAFEDFFNATDENGSYLNTIGAFQPIYFAGYVMDKFDFNDINFNVGVRVDRFDANQKVLKDKFLFKEAYTVGEQRNNTVFASSGGVPQSVKDDYTIYVDDVANPTTVLGYRSGANFYNAQGAVANPKAIKNSSGVIAPYLKNPGTTGRAADLEAGAFKDYDPQINIMPRISFSFPISDEALFTAHYDVLTRRPAGRNRIDMIRYLYIRTINSSSDNPINNPALKPEKTIDYEVGFQQVLSKSSSLKIQMFYREIRDQIQVYQNVGAYPQDYFSIDNLDFGTVKGLTVSYDLRKTGNLTLRANYTLQFADGTGSGLGTPVNLNGTDFSTLRTIAPLDFDQRHKINIATDYRFGMGSNYEGPRIGTVPFLQGIGANFTVDLGSGTPYSASTDPGNARLNGGINGSRLPWRFTTNFQIDRDIAIKFKGEGDNAKMGNINVYLLVNNLFNTRNILGVYPYSGNAEDDGYLADSRYQTQIENRTNPASFRDLYALNNLNPGNFSLPRNIRIGVRLDF